MNTLKGLHINLRAIEPTDLAFLYQIENNELFWKLVILKNLFRNIYYNSI